MDLLVGLVAGIATIFFLTPLYVAHHRIQTEKKKEDGKSKSASKILIDLWNQEGMHGIFRGLGSGIFLTINPAIQYTLFEQMKIKFPKMSFILLGAISKLFATIITYPFLTKMVQDQVDIKKKKKEFKSLFKGMDGKLIQCILSNAFLFYFRKLTERFLGIDIK